MKKGKKTFFIVLIVLLLLMGTGCVAMGEYFINYAFKRQTEPNPAFLPQVGDDPVSQNRVRIIKANRKAFNDTIRDWYPEQDIEEMHIKSADGLSLRGRMIYADDPSHKYVILLHGYQGKGDWMIPNAYVYHLWGWNSLVLDLKSHGESEGKWIGMGWKDKDDLLLWINEIVRRDPEAEIVLQGVSMGGATVMMASGLDLPDNVRAIISDCGYTNVWDVFEATLRDVGVPAFPVLHSASLMYRMHNGFFLNDADAISMLEKADPDLPMLFIQGEEDNFVPSWMLDAAYDAKRGVKEKLWVPDTDHGSSYVREPELYWYTIKDFLERHVGL